LNLTGEPGDGGKDCGNQRRVSPNSETMSLDKSIKHGKAHRKPYHKSARFDRTCRPGGKCDWCRNNRLHKHKRQEKPIE
jgi:hypothetical protein